MAIGKPEPTMYQLAMEQMGAQPFTPLSETGDTDILGGKRAGLTTICVLSGSSNREEAEAGESDFIFADIADLLQTWRNA